MPVYAEVEYSRLELILQRLKWWFGAYSRNSPSMPIRGFWCLLGRPLKSRAADLSPGS
jgi:hypothetical protein